MINDQIIFDPVLPELEAVRSGPDEVQQSQNVKRNSQSHLQLNTVLSNSNEHRKENDSQVQHIGTHQSQETVFIDTSIGEYVFVVDLRIVKIPQIDFLLLRQKYVRRHILLVLLISQYQVRGLLDVVTHLRMVSMEADNLVSNHDRQNNKEKNHEVSQHQRHIRECVVNVVVSQLQKGKENSVC